MSGCSSDSDAGAEGTGGVFASGGGGALAGTGGAGTGGTGTGGIVGSGGEAAVGGAGTGGAVPGGSGGAGGTPTEPDVLIIEESELGFCFVDGIIESANAGFSGSGYANTDNAMGTAVEWAIQVDTAGTYALEFRYASVDGRPATLLIDDSPAVASPEFVDTGAWTMWSTVSTDVSLTVGQHRVKLQATSASGLANIDTLTIIGDPVTAIDCVPEELPNRTIYVAGDSTVSTYTDTSSPTDQAGWGQMLHEIFDDRVTVENRALGGRTALWFHLEGGTAWVLERIQPGDYFFVQFGTNDSHTTATFTVDNVTYPRFADANTDFKQHLYDYYVVPTRERSAIPVLVTPPPRNSAYCGVGNSLGGYAQAMRDLGEEQGVIVLDNNQRTFDHLAAICPSPNPEDFFFIRTDGSVDGTHFQENGARAMAGFLGDEMSEQRVGPYQYLLP